jgi:hypothetical protein
VQLRKRTLSEIPPKRIVLSVEEEERLRKEKKPISRTERRSQERKERKATKERTKTEKGRATQMMKGQEREKISLGAVTAGAAGWKEHVQSLFEEELETSWRSSAALEDSSPFTTPLGGGYTSMWASPEAALWARNPLASPDCPKREADALRTALYAHSHTHAHTHARTRTDVKRRMNGRMQAKVG